MSNMINSQPRFGLDTENGVERIFDYATGLYAPIGEDTPLDSVDGTWNTVELARLIKTGQPLHEAIIEQDQHDVEDTRQHQRDQAEERRAATRDKVEQAKADFMADGGVETEEERKQREAKEAEVEAEGQRLAAEEAERQRLAAEQAEAARQGQQPI